MIKYLKKSLNTILNLQRNSKQAIAILTDIGLCILFTWLAFYLRLEKFIKINDITILSVIIMTQ